MMAVLGSSDPVNGRPRIELVRVLGEETRGNGGASARHCLVLGSLLVFCALNLL